MASRVNSRLRNMPNSPSARRTRRFATFCLSWNAASWSAIPRADAAPVTPSLRIRSHKRGADLPVCLLVAGCAVENRRDSLRYGRRDSVELRALLERAPRKEGRPGGPPHWAPCQLKAAAAEEKPSQSEKRWRRCNTAYCFPALSLWYTLT